MKYAVKKLVKDVSPPILFRAAKAFVQRRSNQEYSSERSAQQSSGWYDQSFVLSDEYRRHYTESHYYFLWSVIADRITRYKIRTILDIGCGPGQLALLLRDKGVKEYYGIDFSPKRIEWAKKNCPDFTFIVEDAFETDLFETFRYDAVICTEFLEHIEQDIEIITRIRSGARFYGSVPNFPSTSHVRHFRNSSDVYDRYAKQFEGFRVDSLLRDRKGRAYYLLEGIKS